MFPAVLPNSASYKTERENRERSRIPDATAASYNLAGSFHAFPRMILSIMTNWTFVLLNLAGAADGK